MGSPGLRLNGLLKTAGSHHTQLESGHSLQARRRYFHRTLSQMFALSVERLRHTTASTLPQTAPTGYGLVAASQSSERTLKDCLITSRGPSGLDTPARTERTWRRHRS